MSIVKLDSEEQELLKEMESGEWKSVVKGPSDLDKFKIAAENTIKKNRRVNIRMCDRDFRYLQKFALEEGIPYQTFISSILHKFVNGHPTGPRGF